ncbi:hypothetical protein A7P54_09005 [Acinetobacter sp. Ac_3412]|uniref:hypothetical protein n=1 Tax=Acinetobacter sp. Ac_3412 TaxID=1848935 RepID=UPI0014908743|nr:hypothetical protein [Acinetobacter sp. Ac_3412]NNP76559.1 hypothetical protein [Acinetobacter sp. Ac_3412]
MNFYWEISRSPYESQFIKSSTDFGSKNKCYLIDQYSGKQPSIINEEFIRNEKISFPIFPSVLLDSNISNEIVNFITKGECKDGVYDLIKFMTKANCDYSLLFYYLESLCKSKTPDSFLKYAIQATECLLTLHSMDSKIFLESNEIRSNPDALNYYLDLYKSENLKEVATKIVTEFSQEYPKDIINEKLKLIEIALIKMLLVKKFEMKNASHEEQINSFIGFFKDVLKINPAREIHFAIHYFHDDKDQLLEVQSNTSLKKALSKIKSTAWDLYLLRFPEKFFSFKNKELNIFYIATQEHSLANLAKLFSIEQIHIFDNNIFPLIAYDMSNLPENFSPPKIDQTRINNHYKIPDYLHESLVNELKRLLK